MLDKSTVYVLVEGMYFVGEKPMKFQLFGLSEVVQLLVIF